MENKVPPGYRQTEVGVILDVWEVPVVNVGARRAVPLRTVPQPRGGA